MLRVNHAFFFLFFSLGTETFFSCQQCMQFFFGIMVTSLYLVSGPNSSAIALCLVLLHLLGVDPPHKLHLMVKVVEAHEVLVENE
jgi:hypothetical protein